MKSPLYYLQSVKINFVQNEGGKIRSGICTDAGDDSVMAFGDVQLFTKDSKSGILDGEHDRTVIYIGILARYDEKSKILNHYGIMFPSFKHIGKHVKLKMPALDSEIALGSKINSFHLLDGPILVILTEQGCVKIFSLFSRSVMDRSIYLKTKGRNNNNMNSVSSINSAENHVIDGVNISIIHFTTTDAEEEWIAFDTLNVHNKLVVDDSQISGDTCKDFQLDEFPLHQKYDFGFDFCGSKIKIFPPPFVKKFDFNYLVYLPKLNLNVAKKSSDGNCYLTISLAGCINVYDRDGVLIITKQLPLKKNVSVNSIKRINEKIVCLFCCRSNNAAADNNDNDVSPFCLMFHLDNLVFLYEIRGTTSVFKLYCSNSLMQDLMWICDHQQGQYMPMWTSIPSNQRVLQLMKADGTLKSCQIATVISLKKETTKSESTNTRPKRKRKEMKDCTNLSAKMQQKKNKNVSAVVQHNQTDIKELYNNNNVSAAISSQSEFDSLEQKKQELVIGAFQKRLHGVYHSIRKLNTIYEDKRKQLSLLRKILMKTSGFSLNTSNSGEPKEMDNVALNHRKIDTLSATPFVLDQENHEFLPSLINLNDNEISDVHFCDCMCFSDSTTFSLIVIARVVNNSILPIFEMNISCGIENLEKKDVKLTDKYSTSPNLLQAQNPILSNTSAIVPIAVSGQEVWISCKVPLNPNMFSKLSQKNRSINDIVFSIALYWKDISSNVRQYGKAFNEEAEKLNKIILSDKARAIFEVRNVLIQSKPCGLHGAIAIVEAVDMSCPPVTVLISQNIKKGEIYMDMNTNSSKSFNKCFTVGPFIYTRKQNPPKMRYDNLWALNVLQGWLEGCVDQQKPMPSNLSNWTPSKNISYFSHLPGIDLIIEPNATKNSQKSSDLPLDKVIDLLEKVQKESNFPHISFMRPTELSQEHCLLQSIPELDPLSAVSSSSSLLLSSLKAFQAKGGDNGKFMCVGRLVAHIQNGKSISLSENLSNLSSSLHYLSKQMAANGVKIIPIYDTEFTWEIIRLASIYLLEELKLIASAWKLQKIRNTNDAIKSSSNSSNVRIESELVTIGQNLHTTKVLAYKCHRKRRQTDLIIAQMLESTEILL